MTFSIDTGSSSSLDIQNRYICETFTFLGQNGNLLLPMPSFNKELRFDYSHQSR